VRLCQNEGATRLGRHDTPRDGRVEIRVVNAAKDMLAQLTGQFLLSESECRQGHRRANGGAGRVTERAGLRNEVGKDQVVAGRDEG
jgi:hypothetical protein